MYETLQYQQSIDFQINSQKLNPFITEFGELL